MSLRSLADPAAHATHLPWIREHSDDPALYAPEYALLRDLAVAPTTLLPGFLAPTPTSPLTEFTDELAQLAATSGAVVRRELAETYADRPLPTAVERLARAPGRMLGQLATQLAQYWQRALAADWARLQATAQADISYRARVLTEHGPQAVFRALHRDIVWQEDVLEVRNRAAVVASPDRELRGRGLVLVPSAFAWPRVYVKTSEPWVPVIRYPMRGVALIWHTHRAAPELAGVLGASRAALLDALGQPHTTTDLARITGLAASGVSAHLHRLTRAGLVTAARTGRHVLYARTATGDRLVGATAGEQPGPVDTRLRVRTPRPPDTR